MINACGHVWSTVSASLAVIAVRGDDTIVARGYGLSDLEQGTNASAETIYLYCSMTKLFTATALMQLRERGLVDLDRAVRTYLPNFALHHPSRHEVTVRHLLSHSSGIANPIPVSWVHLAEEPVVNLDDFTKRLLARYHRLTFEPGSRYAYSNLGYLVLGQVIERISGQSYTDYIQQHILEVLDMHRTGFSYDHLQDQDVATGYVRSWSMMGILGRFLGEHFTVRQFRHRPSASHSLSFQDAWQLIVDQTKTCDHEFIQVHDVCKF